MKKVSFSLPIFFTIFLMAIALASSAKPVSSQCSGKLIINVTYKIENSIDSGEAGNYWAYDYINRHIQVRQIDEGVYCAEVMDEGYFITIAGRSPGDTSDISEGIKGRIIGGYVMTINGELNPEALYDYFGNIGKFDYQCHPENGVCDDLFNWISAYFDPGYTYSYVQWGWTYRAGKNGTWVNSSEGNSGDITD